jgi:DNA invertase Pin-like site-specific DNA recombinase
VPVMPTTPVVRAVAYVRMSTEHQKYSIMNQLNAIKEYAVQHGLYLTRVYSDEGISGLKIDNRVGLQKLIDDVADGKPDFGKVLVYDVSRWGRFQDTDESAYYEFGCRKNGVDVIYCAEPFQDDKSPLSAVVKSMKRAMAAEYSRELGARIFRAQCTLSGRGFNVGGRIPYGYKSLLVDSQGQRLKRSTDRKMLPDCHVRLAVGPAHEVRTTKEIFRRYVSLRESTTQIADYLNTHGYRTRNGGRWGNTTIAEMLTNEKYVGTQTYNKTSTKLGSRRKCNDESDWIRKLGSFKGIVDPKTFARAQRLRKMEIRGKRPSDDDLLMLLRKMIAEHDVVSCKMLRDHKMPTHQTYARHFGSLTRAYDLVGYDLYSKTAWMQRKHLEEMRVAVLQEIEDELLGAGVDVKVRSTCRITLNGVRCSFSISKREYGRVVGHRWHLRIRHVRAVDFHLIGRLAGDRSSPSDYYLFPDTVASSIPTWISGRNARSISKYRCPNLRLP